VNLLLDMNLSPVLARLLSSHGHDVVHWSEVGDYRATDVTILA
jgi:predicted nuclease of predicted toxin-antitoxin system